MVAVVMSLTGQDFLPGSWFCFSQLPLRCSAAPRQRQLWQEVVAAVTVAVGQRYQLGRGAAMICSKPTGGRTRESLMAPFSTKCRRDKSFCFNPFMSDGLCSTPPSAGHQRWDSVCGERHVRPSHLSQVTIYDLLTCRPELFNHCEDTSPT